MKIYVFLHDELVLKEKMLRFVQYNKRRFN